MVEERVFWGWYGMCIVAEFSLVTRFLRVSGVVLEIVEGWMEDKGLFVVLIGQNEKEENRVFRLLTISRG